MRKAHKENSQFLCEANYQKLGALFPEVAFFDHIALSNKNKQVTFAIDVLERTPYTTLINLKSSFVMCAEFSPETLMQVRIYHDANVAEVVKIQNHHRIRPHYPYPNTCMHMPDEKRQSNQLLSEILSFCQDNRYQKALLAAETFDE